jgi:enoyl-CoA hydratase
MGIRRDRRGAIEVLTIDRPEKRNALDPPTIDAIGETFLEIEHDDAVAVLVITGAGDRAFCAGMDLASFADGRQRLAGVAAARYEAFYRTGLAKPVVAAVNGSAVGGGFELLLACDLAVAADHALFGIPEVKRGLFAGAGGTLLPTRVPAAIALEMGLTGDLITAARAYELGLVNRVVPGIDVLAEAVAIAERIAVNAPFAVRVTKRLMYDALESPTSVAWTHVMDALPEVLATADAQEGSRAFVEKRPPRWTGA